MNRKALQVIEMLRDNVNGITLHAQPLQEAVKDSRTFRVKTDSYEQVPVFIPKLSGVPELDNAQGTAFIAAEVALIRNKPQVMALMGPNNGGKTVLAKFLPYVHTMANIANLTSAAGIQKTREALGVEDGRIIEKEASYARDLGALVTTQVKLMRNSFATFIQDIIRGGDHIEAFNKFQGLLEIGNNLVKPGKMRDIRLMATQRRIEDIRDSLIEFLSRLETPQSIIEAGKVYNEIMKTYKRSEGMNLIKQMLAILEPDNVDMFEEMKDAEIVKYIKDKAQEFAVDNKLGGFSTVNYNNFKDLAYVLYSIHVAESIKEIKTQLIAFVKNKLHGDAVSVALLNINNSINLISSMLNGNYKTIDPLAIWVGFVNDAGKGMAEAILDKELRLTTIALEEINALEPRVAKSLTATTDLLLMVNADSTQKDIHPLPTNVLDIVGIVRSEVSVPVEVISEYIDDVLKMLQRVDPNLVARWHAIEEETGYEMVMPAILIDVINQIHYDLISEKMTMLKRNPQVKERVSEIVKKWTAETEALESRGSVNVRKLGRDLKDAIFYAIANAMLKHELLQPETHDALVEKIYNKIKAYSPKGTEIIMPYLAAPILTAPNFYGTVSEMHKKSIVYLDSNKEQTIDAIINEVTNNYSGVLTAIDMAKQYIDTHAFEGFGKAFDAIGHYYYNNLIPAATKLAFANPSSFWELIKNNQLFIIGNTISQRELKEFTSHITPEAVKAAIEYISEPHKKLPLSVFMRERGIQMEAGYEHSVLAVAGMIMLAATTMLLQPVKIGSTRYKTALDILREETGIKNLEYTMTKEFLMRVTNATYENILNGRAQVRAHVDRLAQVSLSSIASDARTSSILSEIISSVTGIQIEPTHIAQMARLSGSQPVKYLRDTFDLNSNEAKNIWGVIKKLSQLIYQDIKAPGRISAVTIVNAALAQYNAKNLSPMGHMYSVMQMLRPMFTWNAVLLSSYLLGVNGQSAVDYFDERKTVQYHDKEVPLKQLRPNNLLTSNQQLESTLGSMARAYEVDGYPVITYLMIKSGDAIKPFIDQITAGLTTRYPQYKQHISILMETLGAAIGTITLQDIANKQLSPIITATILSFIYAGLGAQASIDTTAFTDRAGKVYTKIFEAMEERFDNERSEKRQQREEKATEENDIDDIFGKIF